ncbi:MAG: DUF4339 domain-containing protein [Akkermansiaceae bacterium]|nr:DUF4339 domain-containing protein [Akkermansiaceae bacterium]
MEYHLYQNDQQVGPYTQEQISTMLANGELTQDDFIWHEGLPEWKTIREVIPAASPAPAGPPKPPFGHTSNQTSLHPQSQAPTSGSNSPFPKIRVASLLGALGIFFMPWLDIQCSGTSLATQTGIQVITGASSPSEQMENMAAGEMATQEGPDADDSLGRSILVGLALALLAVAIVLSLMSLSGGGGTTDKLAALLPIGALALLLIQLMVGFPAKQELLESIKEGSGEAETSMADPAADPMGGAMEEAMGGAMEEAIMANFKVEVQPAFYFELVALGIPALLLLGSQRGGSKA